MENQLQNLQKKVESIITVRALPLHYESAQPVRITGLQRAEHLNGKFGRVVSWKADSNRYAVCVDNQEIGIRAAKLLPDFNAYMTKGDMEQFVAKAFDNRNKDVEENAIRVCQNSVKMFLNESRESSFTDVGKRQAEDCLAKTKRS